MGFLDDAKKKLGKAVDEHGDKIGDGLDKAGDVIDKKTGGKHKGTIAAGVDRAGASERQHGDPSQVDPLFDGVHACRCGHVLVHDLVDAGGRLHHIETQGAADGGDGALGGVTVEGHVAPEEPSGVEDTQHDVGVGHGGVRATAAVGRRAGLGARRLRADFEPALPE